MRRFASLAFAVALAAAGPLSAQATHPDFSGKWTLDPASVPAGGMAPTAMTMTVVQDAKTIKMDAAATTQMGEQKTSQTVALDGSSSKNTVSVPGMDLDMFSTAAWEGSTLVITTKADIQGQALQQVDRWSLDTDGKTLTTARNVSVAGQNMDMKLVFKK